VTSRSPNQIPQLNQRILRFAFWQLSNTADYLEMDDAATNASVIAVKVEVVSVLTRHAQKTVSSRFIHWSVNWFTFSTGWNSI
jgi:hypothetical protein